MSERTDREAGSDFMPKFDDKGLLTAVVVHHETRAVLMVGFMVRADAATDRPTDARRDTINTY